MVEPGKPAWKQIREQFGEEMFLEDGHLDRVQMGRLVFSDAVKRRQLNAITHPEIRNAMFWEIFLYFLKGWLDSVQFNSKMLFIVRKTLH